MTDRTIDEMSDDERKLLRATRVITRALGGAIGDARPALIERYGASINALLQLPS